MTDESTQQLQALQRFSEVSAHSADLGVVYEAVYQAITEAIGGNLNVLVAHYDPGDKLISIPYAFNGRQGQSWIPYQLREDTISQLIVTRQPIILGANLDEQESAANRVFSNRVAQSLLGVPLLVADEPIGAILLQDFEQANRFNQSDIAWIGILAGQLAAYLQSADLLDQTRQQLHYGRLLFEITNKIRDSKDMNAILATTATELGRVYSARRVSIEINVEALPAIQPADPAQ